MLYGLPGRRTAVLLRAALLVALSAVGLSAANAASSVTNREDAAVTVRVVAGSARVEHVLQPMQRLGDICAEGCILEIIGREDARYVLEGNEDVSIEDGFVYYDGTAKSLTPSSDDATTKK